MLSTSNVLMVGALFCVLMLLVHSSLLARKIPGITIWCIGDALGATALLLYSYGLVLPPALAYEAANGTFIASSAFMFAGFCCFFGRRIPWGFVGLVIAAGTLASAYFHYVHFSFAYRTASISIGHSIFCAGIGWIVWRHREQWRSPFAGYMTIVMSAIIAAGHMIRSAIYLFNTGEIVSLLQPTGWNLFFVSAGTFIIPVFGICAMLLAHDALMAHAEHAANRDFLTGAWSRRAFFAMADREQAISLRHDRPLSLLLLDVDHFKQINDRFGHAVGDEVLIDLVTHATAMVRNVDYLGRVGGEEFAFLLPETDSEFGTIVAERLRAALDRSIPVSAGRRSPLVLHYTVSMGLATLKESEDFPSLMRRADRALYEAKQRGRNCFVRAERLDEADAEIATEVYSGG